MVLVDTSVWIAALRRAASSEARHLETLLDTDQVSLAAPVRIEILSGASRGLRVLAFARREMPTAQRDLEHEHVAGGKARVVQRSRAIGRERVPAARAVPVISKG